MLQKETVYQSILSQLSTVPTDYLQEVDTFLRSLNKQIRKKEQQPSDLLDFAGTWADMPEAEFLDFLNAAKATQAT
jgi:hypothetical protein